MEDFTKDYINSLFFGAISVLMGVATIYLAGGSLDSKIAFTIGGIFLIGGVALCATAWRRLLDFRKLKAEGKKQDVWISVHNTGSGISSATSFLVKAYRDKTEKEAIVTFEVREIMETKRKEKAVLLKRKENTGMVVLYVDGQMLLPSSGVRYR
jgi:hypothetical protein